MRFGAMWGRWHLLNATLGLVILCALVAFGIVGWTTTANNEHAAIGEAKAATAAGTATAARLTARIRFLERQVASIHRQDLHANRVRARSLTQIRALREQLARLGVTPVVTVRPHPTSTTVIVKPAPHPTVTITKTSTPSPTCSTLMCLPLARRGTPGAVLPLGGLLHLPH